MGSSNIFGSTITQPMPAAFPLCRVFNEVGFNLTFNMSADDLEGDDIWGDSAGETKQAELEESSPAVEEQEEVLEDDETRHMTVGELRQRIHLLNNDIRIMKSDVQRITHESRGQRERIRENQEKVKLSKQLPYLVANVVEVLEPDAEDGEDCLELALNALLFAMFLIPSMYCTCRVGRRRTRSRRRNRCRCSEKDAISGGEDIHATNDFSSSARPGQS